MDETSFEFDSFDIYYLLVLNAYKNLWPFDFPLSFLLIFYTKNVYSILHHLRFDADFLSVKFLS